MKILVTFPKCLKAKVIHDLELEKKRADNFNVKTTTGKLGKMIGIVGRASPIFKLGMMVDYKWSDVTDTSLKLEVIMPVEAFLKESILYGRIRNQFIKSYKHIVQTRLIK